VLLVPWKDIPEPGHSRCTIRDQGRYFADFIAGHHAGIEFKISGSVYIPVEGWINGDVKPPEFFINYRMDLK